MKIEIINNFTKDAYLTTDSPASSYGIPVLEIDGLVYGPDDSVRSADEDASVSWMMDDIQTAKDFINAFVFGAGGRAYMLINNDAVAAANLFLSPSIKHNFGFNTVVEQPTLGGILADFMERQSRGEAN